VIPVVVNGIGLGRPMTAEPLGERIARSASLVAHRSTFKMRDPKLKEPGKEECVFLFGEVQP
jgi:hypothetical protein